MKTSLESSLRLDRFEELADLIVNGASREQLGAILGHGTIGATQMWRYRFIRRIGCQNIVQAAVKLALAKERTGRYSDALNEVSGG